jgi:CRISPR/Cas system-associated exonuclease Cas4 (RecB family)
MSGRSGQGPWASASDLAEYAYCPRAWYYRKHPPAAGRSPDSERRSSAGTRYHRSTLAETEFRERHGGAYAAALLIALALVAGGVWWLWH